MADVSGTRANGRDNLMKMLLSSGTTMPVSSNVTSILPASPSGEYSDDNANRFSAYLHRIAGFSDVVKDHSYAKPWNWKPDNIYVKPVKKLFFGKLPNSTSMHWATYRQRMWMFMEVPLLFLKLHRNYSMHIFMFLVHTPVSMYIHILCYSEKLNSEREIDVEEIDVEDKSVPYDLSRSRHHMDEFQRLANFVRPDDTEDDWEEKIDKILWSPVHHRIFSRVLRILSSERLARLAKSNCSTEPIFRRTSVDTAGRRFRETLASTGWDWKITQWLHSLLFDHLPREYLAIYLDILQTLRLKIPQLIDRMIAVQPNINAKVGAISWETLSSLLKRSWDPFATCLNSNRPKKLPGNPILIIAPSSIGTNVSSRQHKWISQLGTLGMVVNVHMHQGMAASRLTMMACMEQLVQATRAKIQDVRVDCPGRPIILVGFNSGAAMACQLTQMEPITAVICFGFPFTTVEGKRGTPDDTLMDIKCPVMFVIGENASLVRPDDLEYVREKMFVETSLVVVGTADDHLRISTKKKISEGITQSMVDRCILDEIGDFVAGILLQPHPLPPRPFSLTSSNYDVKEKIVKKEPRKRKNSTSSSVDSETNVSPNVKKSRPVTPVSMASNQTPMSVASRLAPLAAQSAFLAGTGGASNPTAPVSNNSQAPVQKRRSRVTNTTQKHHYSDHMVSSKHMTQQHASSTSNGGITLNIGSLASLAPIGPIRLAPTVASQSALTAAKGSINCRSPVTLAPKMPKIMHTNTSQTTKMKTVLPTSTSSNWSKGFSKMTAANCANINLVDRGTEIKSYNILNTSGNQVATGASPLVPQNKSPGNLTTSGPLTALLQSGKNALGAMSNSIVTGRGIPSSSSSILLTPCINSSSAAAGTITTSASAKVTDSSAVASVSSDRPKISNSSMPCCSKKNILDSSSPESGSAASPAENGLINKASINTPMLLPFTNKTPATILPLSGRFKTGQRYANSVPKITMNSNNLQKSQRGKLQTLQTIRKKNAANEVDEDLGNILDIPIIFAKDGDNLNMIEREHFPLGQIHRTNPRIDPTEIKPKRLGSTTKVVLISNKQQPDKSKTTNPPGNIIARNGDPSDLGQRNLAQVILHARSENQPIPLGTSRNVGGVIPLQSATRSNQPTIKYTKIILAKRNSGLPGTANNCDKGQQIILTKSATKLSVAKAFQRDANMRPAPLIPLKISNAQEQNHFDDTLEIEDAIKTNIIERKLPSSIPEIDLTSPIKNQQLSEFSVETNASGASGREGHDVRQIEMDA